MDRQWAKIKDRCFLYYLDQEAYVVQTLPFKIFRLPGAPASASEIGDLPVDEIPQHGLVPPQSYFLPLLIVTNACNLACSYCYAWQGTYGLELSHISTEIVDRTLRFAASYLPRLVNHEQVELGLVLFGGEPTLNPNILEYAITRMVDMTESLSEGSATRYYPSVTINTNALSLSDGFLKLVRNHKERTEVVVSYDGLWHDEYRSDKQGEGSSARTEANIYRLLDSGAQLGITMVVPPTKMPVFKENVEHVAAKFGRDININTSFVRGAIPSVESRAVYPGVLEQSYTQELVHEWGKDTKALILDGYNIYWRRFKRRVAEGGYLYRCPAMLYEFCVTPSGDVYPCHNFTESRFRLGNILDDGFRIDESQDNSKLFLSRRLDTLHPCVDCLFQSICLPNFDCPAHSLHDLGDLFAIDDRMCAAAQEVMSGLLQRLIQEIESGRVDED